jgi:hypothetical protein
MNSTTINTSFINSPRVAIIAVSFIVIFIIIYIIVRYYLYEPWTDEVLSSIIPLNDNKELVSSNDTMTKLLGTSSSTVCGFFKLTMGDRTSKYTDNYIPILKVENNWYLEIIPATNKNDKNSARLRILTNDGTINTDTIELPSIPKFRWIFIAILRDGRRFDIIYDDKIVASKRIENYPVVVSSPLSSGTKGLSGLITHVYIDNKRLSPNSIERKRLEHIDTNNNIVENNTLYSSFPNVSLFGQCLPGLPCDIITTPPDISSMKWNTPFA